MSGVRRRMVVLALGAVAALSIFAVACGGDDNDDNGGGSTPQATLPAAEATDEPTEEAAEPTEPAAGGATTISTTEPPEGGTFLVDAGGFTLYIFEDDVAGSRTSACTGGCASAWPAATVASASATPTASDDVTGILGTIARDDGTIQVTYKGKPLYRFANDSAPGDFNGSTVPKWTIAAP